MASRGAPRRIWDLEGDGVTGDLRWTDRRGAEAWPPDAATETVGQSPAPSAEPAASDARAELPDEVAHARAQIARMAEPDPAEAGPDGAPSGRAKTRLLGFQSHEIAAQNPFASGGAAGPARGPAFPVAWILVTAGPGRGASYTLTSGVASIGRGADQTVCLDFGDTTISRQAHASIAFDDETERFFLGAGAKSNLVRRNDRPVLATEELAHGDLIRLGETTLRFVALCGEGFTWRESDQAESGDGDGA